MSDPMTPTDEQIERIDADETDRFEYGRNCMIGPFRKGHWVRDADYRALARERAAMPDAAAFTQARCATWLVECFGPEIASDKIERNHRFLEEALELVQSTGCTASEAHQLVDYVYGREVGDPLQEVGGVMNTLAALCYAHGMDMMEAGAVEMDRVEKPAMMQKIKAKQAAKPKHSPLPEALIDQPAPVSVATAAKVLLDKREFLLNEEATPTEPRGYRDLMNLDDKALRALAGGSHD